MLYSTYGQKPNKSFDASQQAPRPHKTDIQIPRLNRTIACSQSIHVTAAANAHDQSQGDKGIENR